MKALKEKLSAKLKKQGGFTLVEMLIVVAIIAILVAVSIPLVNNALERARESTDAANERSFKAALTVAYLNGKYETGEKTEDFKINTLYIYDAAKGTITTDASEIIANGGYGKSTSAMGVDPTDRRKHSLYGYVSTTGVVNMVWSQTAVSSQTTVDNKNLISTKMVGDI